MQKLKPPSDLVIPGPATDTSQWLLGWWKVSDGRKEGGELQIGENLLWNWEPVLGALALTHAHKTRGNWCSLSKNCVSGSPRVFSTPGLPALTGRTGVH